MYENLFDQAAELLDTDLWAEACVVCDTTSNCGNGLCESCEAEPLLAA